MVVIDVYVYLYVDIYAYELEIKVGGFQRNVGEFCLTQPSTTGIITTQYHTLDIVQVIGLKLNNIQ